MIQFKNLYEVKCVDGNLQIKISQLLWYPVGLYIWYKIVMCTVEEKCFDFIKVHDKSGQGLAT